MDAPLDFQKKQKQKLKSNSDTKKTQKWKNTRSILHCNDILPLAQRNRDEICDETDDEEDDDGDDDEHDDDEDDDDVDDDDKIDNLDTEDPI